MEDATDDNDADDTLRVEEILHDVALAYPKPPYRRSFNLLGILSGARMLPSTKCQGQVFS